MFIVFLFGLIRVCYKLRIQVLGCKKYFLHREYLVFFSKEISIYAKSGCCLIKH